MGKIRKRKPSKNKPSVAVVDNSDYEELEEDVKENVIQTIIDQIQSANVEEKYCGLQTFAMHIESPESLGKIINRDLVKIVAPLLLDAASSVRNAAAGSLRNLSALQPQLCDVLMEHDVMTPLVCYFHQFTESWIPETSGKTKTEDTDTFIQNVNLLLNLCESSELAVKYLGDSRILDILPRYLDISTFGSDVVIAVMQCLFVVIEDNPKAIEKIKLTSENQLRTLLLMDGSEPHEMLIKTLAAGVIINLCNGNMTTLSVELIHQTVAILAQTLSVDHRLICNQLSSNIPLKDTSGNVTTPKGKEAQMLECQIKSVLQALDALQSSIEIVTNICSCEELNDTIDDEESTDNEEMGEENISTNGEGFLLAEDKLPPEILEAFISLQVYEKVWARTQLPAENVLLILKEYEESQLIYKKLLTLQTKALLCINNILSTIPLENLGGVSGVYKIWIDAGKLVFKQSTDNVNLSESATAVMRAALDKIKSSKNKNTTECNLFQDMALSDLEIMISGIRECQVPEIRSNLIRMIGILALLLADNINDTTSNVICTITEFILDQAHKENEVWVLAEAVDTVMDLYSEDETDPLAAKVKLADKLSTLAPILRNKARQQKKLPSEYKVLVSTANSNLPRFIKYIREQVSNL